MKRIRTRKIAAWLLAVMFLLTMIPGQKARAAITDVGKGPVIIYEAYGGGGNTGAIYKNDFVVLKNISTAAVDLSTWSLQYASAANPFSIVVPLSGTIEPGVYYVIKGAPGANTTLPDLPRADVEAPSLTMGAANFKLALSKDQTKIDSSQMPSVIIDTYPNLVDYLGTGTASAYLGTAAASALSNSTSAIRIATEGNNATDYVSHTPELSYLGTVPPPPPPPEPTMMTIAEARAMTSGAVTTKGVVTFIDGRNVVIQDATAGINLFLSAADAAIALGDEITATGTRSAYKLLEQIAVTSYTKGEKKALPAPQAVTLETLLDPVKAVDYESERVVIRKVTLGAIVPTGNTVITSGTSSFNIYKMPALTGIVEGDVVDVTAVLSRFTNYQLRVVLGTDVKLNSNDPISDEMAAGLTTLDQVLAGGAGKTVTTIGQVAYTFGGNTIILQDLIGGEIIGLQVYDFTNFSTYKIGDIVKVTGPTSLYGGVLQVNKPTAVEVAGSAEPFAPQEVTLLELTTTPDKYMSEFVKIKDVTLGTYSSSAGTPITDATGSLTIYRGPAFPLGVTAGSKVDLLAVMSKYNTTLQLRMGATSDYIITEDLLSPSITLPTFLPAKVLTDYSVAIEVVDNVGVESVTMTYTIGSVESAPVTLVKNETSGKYQATIPGDKIHSASEMTLKFTALDAKGNKGEATGTVVIDNRPQVVSVAPAANTATGAEKMPQFVVELANAGDNPKVELTLNGGTPILMSVSGSTATYKPAAALADGKVEASVLITRTDNVVSDPYVWNFYIGEPVYKYYFGQLHAHTNYSDGAGTPDQALTYAQNVEQIDFLALTDHSNYFDSSTNLGTFDNANSGTASTVDPTMSKWAYYKSIFEKYTTSDFLALYGFEMTWSGQYGHINTFGSDGFVSRNNPALSAKNGDGLKAYYELLKGQTGTISQFNHPGATFGTFQDFGYYDVAIDNKINLIEVGNGEGPVRGSGYFPSYQYYTQALDKGWHLAPTNGQDNHKGKWGDANTSRTVIIADSLTKEALFEAVDNLQVYATEDNNFELYYTANNMPMGTIFTTDPDKLDILVELNDPDAADVIGKVSVIVDGGIVAHTETINTNSGKMAVTLSNDYSYYYIKVEQGDGDIIVSAPVWTGEVTQVGINELTKDTSMDIKGETTKLSASLYNFEASDLQLTKVSVYVNDVLLESLTTGLPSVKAGTEMDYVYSYVPSKIGKQTIRMDVEATMGGTPFAFTKSIDLNVYDNNSVVDIAIDAAHDNFYVSGDYANNDSYITTVAGQKGARVRRITTAITAESLEGVELLILTVPYLGFGKMPKTYTAEEIAVIKAYAEKGGNLILTSKSDRGNPGGLGNADVISNEILTAIGAKARIGGGIVVDNVMKSNEAYRLSFKDTENFNDNTTFGAGILDKTNKTFSAYNAAPVIPNGATTIVRGYATTWAASYTENFTGSAYVPNYDTDKVVVPMNEVSVVTEETLPGGGFLVTAGVTFFSNFEVTVEMLIEESVRNANFMIVNNIIDEIKGDPVITPISDVQKAEEGLPFTIEGILTSNASGFDRSTAFFDSAYVQDATGGINIFPIAGNYQAGQKVRITGTTSSYQGEQQLNIDTIELLDATINPILPLSVLTKDVPANLGRLVSVEGLVLEIQRNLGVVESIVIQDASGVPSRIFIDGYIGTDVVMPEIKVGDTVKAIGLSSIDPLGSRIRVRDRAEVTLVKAGADKTALASLLDQAKATSTAGMTAASAKALADAMAAAEKVLLDEKAEQAAVDAAKAALEIALAGLVADPSVFVLVDEATGVKVYVPAGAFATKPVLKVTKVEYKIKDFTTSAFDISFLVNGVRVQPKVKVTVSLPLGSLDAANLYLFHVLADQKLAAYKFTVKGTQVEFESKSFSVYVLASGTGTLPKTGQTSTTVFYLFGLLTMAGGWVLLTKKKSMLN